MKRLILALACAAALAGSLAAAPQGAKTLDIYVIDPEGGKSALIVTPSGQAVVIDTGNPGGRDVDRLMEAIKTAGVTKIDYLVTTHYHIDHIGGLQDFVTRIPVETFVDHGPTVEEREQVAGFQAAYAEIYGKAKHMVVKPGDTLPLDGVDWRIVTSAGQVLTTNLPGGGQPNPACADFARDDNTRDPENGQSVGSVVTYGQFRMIDLGDLLWNNEGDLMCPNNPIGTVDLYMVSHHGTDPSGSKALVHGLRPRVAVMQNGTRKGGGTPKTFDTIITSPGLEDLWQLHWSHNGMIERNPPGLFIANVEDNEAIAGVLTAPPRGAGPGGRPGGAPAGNGRMGAGAPGAPGAAQAAGPGRGQGRAGFGRGRGTPPHTPAYLLKISAQQDGTFTVTNTRNGFSKTYTK